MVVRIGGEPRLQFGDLAGRRAGLLGQFERRAGGGDLALLGRCGGQGIQNRAGLLEIAGRHGAARETGRRSQILGLVLEHLGVDRGGGSAVARVQGGLRLFHRGFDGRRSGRARAAGQIVDEGLHLAFRQGAHEPVDRLAVHEGIDRRDGLDAHLLGEGLVLVDIDLDQPDRAAGGLDHFLDRRAELLARPAPRRPEVDDDRRVHRRVDHVVAEPGRVAVLDQGAVARARLSDDLFHEKLSRLFGGRVRPAA
jgi:hypothetical protein